MKICLQKTIYGHVHFGFVGTHTELKDEGWKTIREYDLPSATFRHYLVTLTAAIEALTNNSFEEAKEKMQAAFKLPDELFAFLSLLYEAGYDAGVNDVRNEEYRMRYLERLTEALKRARHPEPSKLRPVDPSES